uniref:Uncharacterized protein n=1 Tax=Periophthalmus magnuspinnatus TaxID=409849 RepID=A0A3B4ALY0_9GOBI
MSRETEAASMSSETSSLLQRFVHLTYLNFVFCLDLCWDSCLTSCLDSSTRSTSSMWPLKVLQHALFTQVTQKCEL